MSNITSGVDHDEIATMFWGWWFVGADCGEIISRLVTNTRARQIFASNVVFSTVVNDSQESADNFVGSSVHYGEHCIRRLRFRRPLEDIRDNGIQVRE